MYHQYFDNLHRLLEDIEASQEPGIRQAAELIAAIMAGGGVIHVFGSGHSHMMVEEVFHRAGGLMPVDAMLDPNLTTFGTLRASMVERTEGYAQALLASFDVRPGEAVIIVSNSGINPVSIDLAIGVKEKGAKVIAITSRGNYATVSSRHSSGQKLADVADVVIDSRVPVGDATVTIDEHGTKMGPASTVIGAAIMNALMVETAELLQGRGIRPPAITSMNIPGGDERNHELLDQYRTRLRLLRD